MEGYIVNLTSTWLHALKRAVGPGGKVPLSELYEQYGVKHNLPKGSEFLNWLRDVKLKDKEKWRIVSVDVSKVESDSVNPGLNIVKDESRGSNTPPMVKKQISVSDIVELSVRQARETLPKVRDLSLLKYSLQEANQRAGKDSLCRLIRNRIKDIQVAM